MVFTSNKGPNDWAVNFDERPSLLCALDRIFDNAKVFTLKGNTLNSNNVTVEWSNQIGTLFIDTYKDFDSSGPDSYLTIKGANSGSFQLTKFTEVIYSDPVNGDVSGPVGLCLTDVNSPGCQIKISKWFSEQQFSGITFGNGEFLSYYDINAKFSGI